MFVKGAGANQLQLDHTMVFKDKDHTLGKGYRPLLALPSGPQPGREPGQQWPRAA